MDSDLLVKSRINDGAKLIVELLRDHFDVTVAFWAKKNGGWSRSLYIGSASVDLEKIGDANQVFLGSLSRLPGTSIGRSDVMLLPVSHPIVTKVVALRGREGVRTPTRFRRIRIDDLTLSDVLVYPPLMPLEVIAKGREEVLRFLECQSQVTTGGPGVYELARDETGALVLFLAGHCFAGAGTARLGDKNLVVVDGSVREVRDN